MTSTHVTISIDSMQNIHDAHEMQILNSEEDYSHVFQIDYFGFRQGDALHSIVSANKILLTTVPNVIEFIGHYLSENSTITIEILKGDSTQWCTFAASEFAQISDGLVRCHEGLTLSRDFQNLGLFHEHVIVGIATDMKVEQYFLRQRIKSCSFRSDRTYFLRAYRDTKMEGCSICEGCGRNIPNGHAYSFDPSSVILRFNICQ